MPYEDEDPPYEEPDEELNRLSKIAIDAAYEVYGRLGAGLDEKMYENAMCIELRERGVSVERQVKIDVHYKGIAIGKRCCDLIVGERLLLELKAVEKLTALHKAQVRTYLKIAKLKLGLLINFNTPLLRDDIKRIINPSVRSS